MDNMSQFPVPTSDEHAGQSSSMASCDTFQKLPVEPKPGAPSFLGSNKSDQFPFMKLAVETRLEIYNYLLIALPSRPKNKIVKIFSPGVSLDFYTIRDADQEKKIACKRLSSCRKLCASINLTPQILRTCKTIHQEAAPILYQVNLFQFQLRDTFKLRDPNVRRQERLEYVRRELYQNPAELWGVKDPEAPICSPFAVFLRQIGQRNAASLRRLKFDDRTNKDWLHQRAEEAIEVITQLLKSHVPGAREVKICHDPFQDPDHWDAFEDGILEPVEEIMENDPTLPFVRKIQLPKALEGYPLDSDTRETQDAMCRAIKEMIEKVTWLKRLRITRFNMKGAASNKVEELEAIVKARG